MLHWYIKIFHYFVLPLYTVDKLIGDTLGIAVKQAYPLKALYPAQLIQKLGQGKLSVQVKPVACGVLRHNHKLLHPVCCQQPCLIDDIFNRTASESTAYLRNSTVCTAVVAAVRYAHISIVRQRGQYTFALHAVGLLAAETAYSLASRNLVQYLAYPAVFRYPHHRVDLGEFLDKLLTVTLRKTACDHNMLYPALIFEIYQLHYPADSLLLCGLYEPAGVHQRYIGKPRFLHESVSLFRDFRHHLLRVHLVFGTAQRNYRYFYSFFTAVFTHSLSSSS